MFSSTHLPSMAWPNRSRPGHEHKYAIQMAPQGRGHALFDPYPGKYGKCTGQYVRNPCVEIGDVGYVARGSFHLLFNAHRQASDTFQIHGVPKGFIPLERRQDLVDHRQHPSPRLIHSSSKVAIEIGAGASVPGAAGGLLCWSLEREAGASLAYFDQYEVWDAQDIESYRFYFRKNAKSWLDFVGSLRLGLTLKDIVFVTGCDRTRAWATLWSETGSVSGGVSLEIQTSIGPCLKLTGSVQWHNAHSVPSLSGPPADELSSSTRELFATLPIEDMTALEAEDLTMRSVTPSLDVAVSVPADQCVFIRGFRGRDIIRGTPYRLRGGSSSHGFGHDWFPQSLFRGRDDITSSGSSGTHVFELPTSWTSRPPSPSNFGRVSESPVLSSTDWPSPIELMETPGDTDDTLVTLALDITEKIYRPKCEDNILLMHDYELAQYLPEPGSVEHALWDSLENVYPYLESRLRKEPPRCLTRVGSSWVQGDT